MSRDFKRALIADLKGVIYKDPGQASDDPLTGWQTADEYLSGNVRRKLIIARRAAEKDPAYQSNVDALIPAQPKDLDASEIEVRLGATWIDPRYIQQFMYEVLNTPERLRDAIRVLYSKHTGEWQVTQKFAVSHDNIAAYTTYGTNRANAYHILEDSLNLRDVRIYDTVQDPDGKERRVLNGKETTLAAQKQQALRDEFQSWIWRDPERRQELTAYYNQTMNCIRPREYDGSHIVFSGINPSITLQPHQLGAIARVLYGGNTLLAHEVGAGSLSGNHGFRGTAHGNRQLSGLQADSLVIRLKFVTGESSRCAVMLPRGHRLSSGHRFTQPSAGESGENGGRAV